MPRRRPQSVVDGALLLSDLGVLDVQTALIFDIAVTTVRTWRRSYQRRGRSRGHVTTNALCPRCDGVDIDAAAYVHLLGWYLGDGHIVEHRGRPALLAVFNDIRYPNDSDELAESIRRVKGAAAPHRRYRSNMRIDALGWRHWPCLFPQHGPGRKHDRPIVLEDWQRLLVIEHPEAMVRGLFHSDGCRVTNSTTKVVAGSPKRYEYIRYFFTTSRTASWRSPNGRSTCSASSTDAPEPTACR